MKNGNLDRTCLRCLLGIGRQRCDLASDLCIDNFLATLLANPGGDIFNDDQFTFNPKVMIDLSLSHLLAANVTMTVIINTLIHILPKS